MEIEEEGLSEISINILDVEKAAITMDKLKITLIKNINLYVMQKNPCRVPRMARILAHFL
ncbi:hypothetical protein ABE41_012120 [Fictibacillus arsenicus]|uniref:Uncharacterized protein n=1 Tax=Fictibacillus arsenicus TaxID=255247 RepID=A0A1B1Z5N7_9BACL|nr:hypothetical protein ABE41_012120 [Fictibacillus arsenicus]